MGSFLSDMYFGAKSNFSGHTNSYSLSGPLSLIPFILFVFNKILLSNSYLNALLKKDTVMGNTEENSFSWSLQFSGERRKIQNSDKTMCVIWRQINMSQGNRTESIKEVLGN